MFSFESTPRRRFSLLTNETALGWLFSAPALLLILFFLIIPFGLALSLSFTDQRLVPAPTLPTSFVGFDNYLGLLKDANFGRALLNNFYFAAVVVPLQSGLGLCLALLVNQRRPGAALFRIIYLLPVMVSMVVVSIIWVVLYNPDAGVINAFIGWISGGELGPYSFLRSRRLALPAIMLFTIWASAGVQMVIFLAGLQEIPGTLYDAAAIDGAGPWQKIRYVTLPLLRRPFIFVIVTTTILSFRLFTQVQITTNGGPANASLTTVLYAVQEGWQSLRVGYASAISVIFFLIVLLIALVQRVFLRPA